jgi:hypothetical protein
MIGGALLLMWLFGLIFHVAGIFVWFLLGFSVAAAVLGFLAPEEI